MLRSFARLMQVDPGFNPQHALTVEINLLQRKYAHRQQQNAFWQQALERIRALPGIQSAGVVQRLPLKGNPGIGFSIEGRPDPPPSEYRRANYRVISPDYFSVMGIPLVRGRGFTEQEAWQDSGAVIINQALAKRYWPAEDPLGKRIGLGAQRLLTIVGIAADVKDAGLEADFQEGVYLPMAEIPSASMSLIARTRSEPRSVAAMIRREIAALDKEQSIANISTLEELVSRNIAQPRFNAALFFIFGAVALVLALVGIYGVMAYAVTQRTQEFGVRMALGAQDLDVLRLVLGQGLRLTLLGVGVGLIGALAGTKVLARLLFQTSRTDPTIFVGVSLLLIIVALLACYFPARRATKVDPTIALQQE
jgi:putative ABC transport system permease protein